MGKPFGHAYHSTVYPPPTFVQKLCEKLLDFAYALVNVLGHPKMIEKSYINTVR